MAFNSRIREIQRRKAKTRFLILEILRRNRVGIVKFPFNSPKDSSLSSSCLFHLWSAKFRDISPYNFPQWGYFEEKKNLRNFLPTVRVMYCNHLDDNGVFSSLKLLILRSCRNRRFFSSNACKLCFFRSLCVCDWGGGHTSQNQPKKLKLTSKAEQAQLKPLNLKMNLFFNINAFFNEKGCFYLLIFNI